MIFAASTFAHFACFCSNSLLIARENIIGSEHLPKVKNQGFPDRQGDGDTVESVHISDELTCQSFRQGCCGCCVNMRWSDTRIMEYLAHNTREFVAMVTCGRRPCFMELVKVHLRCGGWADHLLAFWLAPLTLGVSAWVWKRWWGSCSFAGFIDPASGRVGCLIHPELQGYPDLRRRAFPLIPTLGCNRKLRCSMLQEGTADREAGVLDVSRQGFWK